MSGEAQVVLLPSGCESCFILRFWFQMEDVLAGQQKIAATYLAKERVVMKDIVSMKVWLAALLAAVVITGCAPAATPESAPAAPPAAQSGDTNATASSGESQIVIAHTGPIYTMDAPVTWFGATHWLTMMLYDCLLWRAPDNNGYVPMLAERWENIEPTRWRFYLRQDATFHNGEVINADVIKWNIDRVRTNEEFMVYGQWQFVDSVEVVDEYTVDIVTKEPRAYTEYDLSFNGCEILPPGYMEEVGPEAFAKNPVGSGPYRLVEFTDGERYVFEAWDGYWGGKPAIDRVIYQVIPERASQVAALLAGQVDMIVDTPYADRPRIEQADGVKLVAAPPSWAHQLDLRIETEHGAVATTYPGFVPATTNKLIRQAISHALDRTLLAEVQGSATPSLVYLISIWPEVDREKYIGSEAADAWYDPELSKQLIIEAGFDPDNGNKPKLYFDASSFDQGGEKEVAEAVTAMLEEVGFEVELTLRDNPTYQEQILRPGNNRDIQMVTTAKGPAILLTQTSCSWEGVNYVCFEELDELNNQILQEVDPVKRAELWGQWWEFYLDEAFTVSMYEIGRFYGMNERLEWTPRADGWITPRDARLVD